MKTKITTAEQAWRRVKFLEKDITRMKQNLEWHDKRVALGIWVNSDDRDAYGYTQRKIERYRKEASGLLARLIRLPGEMIRRRRRAV